eukprot:6478932-Amphidinium_carterae.1
MSGQQGDNGLQEFINLDAGIGSTCMGWTNILPAGWDVEWASGPTKDNSWCCSEESSSGVPPTFVTIDTHVATSAAFESVSLQNSQVPDGGTQSVFQEERILSALSAPRVSGDLGSSCHNFERHERIDLHRKREGELVVGFQNVLSLDATEWRECAEKGLNETIRLRWITKHLHTRGIDVFGMVETRLPDDSHFSTDSHLVIGFRAVAGRDGQMIIICKDLKPQVIWKEAVSERVSRVKVLLAGVPVIVVLAHGPVALSGVHEHSDFNEHLVMALSTAKEEGDRVILLADLNTRFQGCQRFAAIGDMAVSMALRGDEARTQQLAKSLSEQGILLTNTHIQHDNPHTWHHASGYSAQIDYVGLSRLLHGSVAQVRVEPRQDWASSCMSDHDVIVITMGRAWKGEGPNLGKKKRRTKPVIPLRTFVNDDHRKDFIESFAAFKQTVGSACGPASNRFSSLLSDAARVLQETAPQRSNKPRRDWISEESWRLVRQVAGFRKALKVATDVWHADLLAHVWHTWRSACGSEEPQRSRSFVDWSILRFRMRCAVFTSLRTMRRHSKKDRMQWLQKECTEMQELIKDGRVKEYYSKLNKLTKRKSVQHGLLKTKAGCKAYTQQEVAHVWSEHWCGVFDAQEKQVLVDFNNFDVCADIKHDEVEAVSEQEVWRTLKSSAGGKISPDCISIDVLKAIADDATPLLSSMYTQYLRTSEVPTAFKGGVIVPIHKKGSWTDPSNFRPICLMSNTAKMFNRVILERLGFEEAEPTQFSGPGSSVEFPLLCCGMLLQHLRRSNTSGAFLFLDVQQAYDNVSRPYLFGGDDGGAHDGEDDDVPLGSGIPYTRALRMAERFMDELPKLQQMGVEPALLDVMRTSNTSTWLKLTQSHGGRTILTRKGIRQGCRLAPYLFCCFHSIATRRMRDRMDLAGVLMKLPISPTLFGESEDQLAEVEISNLSFVDDLLTPVWSKNPVTLLAMAATLARIVVYTFSEVGLPVNLKPQKTEFLIALRGPRAKDLFEGLRYDGGLCAEPGPVLIYDREGVNGPVAIRVAKHYKYLGKLVTPTGSQLKENRARAGQAMAAVKDMKRVFETVGLSARTKVTTLIVKVLSILLFGAHIMMKMNGPEMKALNTCYMAAIRTAAGEAWGRQHVMTDAQVLRKVGLPTLLHQIHVRRLIFWPKIFMHRSPLIRACLSADVSDHSWWGPQFQALSAFRDGCVDLADWPEPTISSVREWKCGALTLGPRWKVLARQFGKGTINYGGRTEQQGRCDPHPAAEENMNTLVKNINNGLSHPRDRPVTPVGELEQAVADALEAEFSMWSDDSQQKQEHPADEHELQSGGQCGMMDDFVYEGALEKAVSEALAAEFGIGDEMDLRRQEDTEPCGEPRGEPGSGTPKDRAHAESFQCHLCGKLNKSHRGLQSHLRQKHQQVSEVALRITSLKCPACRGNFRSRKMILQHLRDSPSCRSWTIEHIQPMSLAQYREFVKEHWRDKPVDVTDVLQRPAMGRKTWCQVTHRPMSRLAIPLVCIDLPPVP